MKRISKYLAAGAVAAIASLVTMAAAPAGAVVAGGGEAAGTVKLNPGVNLTTQQQTYTFEGVAINGTFTDGSNTFAGLITVDDPVDPATETITGESNAAGDDTLFGEGFVNPFVFQQQTAITGSLSGGCDAGDHVNKVGGAAHAAGGYTRVGSVTLVKLVCDISISGGAATTQNVYVLAQFSPTQGDAVTTPATEANFTGVYETGVDLT